MVELGPTPKVFGDPRHSYTRALLSCVPQLHRKWSDEAPGAANGGPAATADANGGLVAGDDDHFVAPEEDAA